MTPTWRNRIFAAVGAAVAVVMGVSIANESFLWPAVAAGALVTLMLVWFQPLPLSTLLLGFAVIGYVVGNRGFAQLYLSGSFPLLPAELVLLVGTTILFVQCAWRQEMPLARNFLNLTLLLWMLLGSVRFAMDARQHGFTAARDFALVYYAAFFFLAQHAARDPKAADFLHRCLLGGCVALLVVHPLFSLFQSFFLQTLTVRGVPLVFFKGDLAGNFMAVGSLLAFLQWERTRRFFWVLSSLALAGLMLTTNSRSSMVGLAVGAGWLAVSGRWKYLGVLGLSAVFASLILAVVTYVRNDPWEQTPIYALYERVASFVDPLGRRTYTSEEMLSKSDNITFRIVWWRASIDETMETDPWLGLGFGHDLAQRFVREYYPEGNDDFTARSPHNVLITLFARMGVMGLAAFAAFLGAMVVRTWSALRNPAEFKRTGRWWCSAWILLSCACFGVVLEGPMGAVVFWTVLGLASGSARDTAESVAEADTMREPVLQHRQIRETTLSLPAVAP